MQQIDVKKSLLDSVLSEVELRRRRALRIGDLVRNDLKVLERQRDPTLVARHPMEQAANCGAAGCQIEQVVVKTRTSKYAKTNP